jgi:hypothetical protein
LHEHEAAVSHGETLYLYVGFLLMHLCLSL